MDCAGPFPCLPPAARTLLVLRGPDAERFLNGQVTQDVRSCGEKALPACVTDAKGRLQFFVHIFRDADGAFCVEAPPECRDELLARIDRYLIADDVEITDESDRWRLTHILATEPPPGPLVREAIRLGPRGFDFWVRTGEAPALPLSPLPEDETEHLRIRHRLPAWDKELVPGILPPEAGLDRSAISYRKGCYIGQEVLSRIKSAGKLNRRLAALRVPPETREKDPLPGGEITSVSPLPEEDGSLLALGYLGKTAFDRAEIDLPGGRAAVLGFA